MLQRITHLVTKAGQRLIQTPQELRKMRADADPITQKMAQALDAGIYAKLSSEEETWVSRIEAIREQLKSSSQTIEIQDFGAGNPDDDYSTEEMLEGIMRTAALSDSMKSATRKRWALILMKLIQAFPPIHCLEFGTHVGISACYQGAALKMNNDGGKLITLEGANSLAEIARNNLQSLNIDNVTVRVGRFADTLQPALDELEIIHYAFIDGHHEEHATIGYFEQLLPYLADEAVLVFDDHHWNEGMTRAWEYVVDHERVHTAVDMMPFGVALVRKTSQQTKLFTVI